MYDFLPSFLQPKRTPEQKRRDEEWKRERIAARVKEAVPWTDDIKFSKHMTIKADTFNPTTIFPELKTTRCDHPDRIPRARCLVSPDGEWLACRKVFPRGETLWVVRGNTSYTKGDLMFDGDIISDVLHYKRFDHLEHAPMMSITPMEMMTLRTGVRIAEGHTVVVGLGLGYQLIEVAKRKQVKKLTLIEKSQSLVDLIWPRVEPFIENGLKVKIIVDDMKKALPKLTADVALVDIDPGFGDSSWQRDRLAAEIPKIKRLWYWGGGNPVWTASFVKAKKTERRFPPELRVSARATT